MTIEVLVKEHSDELIADLIKWATGKTPLDIRLDDLDDDLYATITLFDYKGDNELSLRLQSNEVYDIHIGYYDDEDEFIEVVQPLSAAQKATLPEKLKKAMKKVLADESGIRLPGNFFAL